MTSLSAAVEEPTTWTSSRNHLQTMSRTWILDPHFEILASMKVQFLRIPRKSTLSNELCCRPWDWTRMHAPQWVQDIDAAESLHLHFLPQAT